MIYKNLNFHLTNVTTLQVPALFSSDTKPSSTSSQPLHLLPLHHLHLLQLLHILHLLQPSPSWLLWNCCHLQPPLQVHPLAPTSLPMPTTPLKNAPTHPNCGGCGAVTHWDQSNVMPNYHWLHKFVCLSGCSPPVCDTELTTPPT